VRDAEHLLRRDTRLDKYLVVRDERVKDIGSKKTRYNIVLNRIHCIVGTKWKRRWVCIPKTLFEGRSRTVLYLKMTPVQRIRNTSDTIFELSSFRKVVQATLGARRQQVLICP
jgi:hypothetical protein